MLIDMKADKWISVEERMPEYEHLGSRVSIDVLVDDGPCGISVAFYDFIKSKWIINGCCETEEPKFWQPLPEPPKI